MPWKSWPTIDCRLIGVKAVATKTPAISANATGTPMYPKTRNRNGHQESRMAPRVAFGGTSTTIGQALSQEILRPLR